jgi:hypothetical protein
MPYQTRVSAHHSAKPVMTIETKGGPITAEFSLEDGYPAIHVCINGQIAAIIEHIESDSGGPTFAVRAYTQDADEQTVAFNYATGESRL